MGVNSTPTLYVNGRPLIGAQPFENFKPIIDEELARSSLDGSQEIMSSGESNSPDLPVPPVEGLRD